MAKKTGNRVLPTRALIEEANKTQRILEMKVEGLKDTAAIHSANKEHTRAGKRRQRHIEQGVEEGRARVASSSSPAEAREVICVEPGCPAETGDLESICLLLLSRAPS